MSWRKRRRRGRRWLPRLRPFAGRRLPKPLRAENVSRLAAALPEGLDDPGLEHLLTRIETSPVLSGNRVTVYTDGTKAFESMLAAIDSAVEEVLLEAYIFRDDATGHAFRDALARAVDRGAAVRVLADGFGSYDTRTEFWVSLKSRNADVRLFHPLLARFWDWAFRDHRKILVVDRRIGFTGGMNIGVEYGSSRRTQRKARGPRSWRDTQVRVQGPTAWEMAIVFEEGWARAGGGAINLTPLVAEDSPGARILTLDTRPGRGTDELVSILTAVLAAARKRLWITNAYFAPRRRAIERLSAAVRRGVDVRLLLPGVSDVPIVQHAAHGYFRALLEGGVRIFEYQEAILHAKSLVADDRVGVVGSTNLDFRSFHLNAECNLVILDPKTAARLGSAFEEDLSRSREIDMEEWRRRSLDHKLIDLGARFLAPVL